MTRKKAIARIKDHKIIHKMDEPRAIYISEALDMAIKALEQEPKTWSLNDAREDFMHDVYNTLDFLPTNEEANRIIDSFDRVTSGIERESCVDAVNCEEMTNEDSVIFLETLKTKIKGYDWYGEGIGKALDMVVEALEKVQPEQKKGRWIKKKSMIYCSYCACGFDSIFTNDFNYCPNCGAEIQGEENED